MSGAHETGTAGPSQTGPRPARGVAAAALVLGSVVLGLAVRGPERAGAQTEPLAPTCFRTGGGSLEVCRDGAEAEGVFAAPGPCGFARGVQILRLATSDRSGPLQMVYHGETPPEERRGKPCTERRATDLGDSGAVRSGRAAEQLATLMPPTAPRLWEERDRSERPRRARSRRDRDAAAETSQAEVGIGPRDPIAVAGRDWAGEEYVHVFLMATAGEGDLARRVQIQARTYDFESFDIRTRGPEGGVTWVPFTGGRSASAPAAVLDETGRPLVGTCAGTSTETQGLAGSISVVGQTYHYFYTDALPEDCGEPVATRRMALFLRTARDLNGPRVWSSPRTLIQGLPAGSLLRVGKGKGMERWAVAYSCRRPASAPGGPVPDICLQYTADMSVDGIGQLKLFADPVAAQRSPAYLGLRSGGDGSGRYDRTAHYWMTDRYGNLETPNTFSVKAGFLTWMDRLAPRADGSAASSLYGRPTYWATWTVRTIGAR